MNPGVEEQVTGLVGENLNRLVPIDGRCQGMIHSLYEALRESLAGLLAMGTAWVSVDGIRETQVLCQVVLTGRQRLCYHGTGARHLSCERGLTN